MSICNRVDLQTLGSQPVITKNLPNHWQRVMKAHAQEVFGHIESVKILQIINPTGYMLDIFRF